GIAVVLLAMLLRGGAGERAAEPSGPGVPSAAIEGTKADEEASSPAPSQPEPPSAARRPGRPLGVAPALAAQAAEDYRQRARYPRSSTPLRADEPDPILRDREVTPVRGRGPHGEEPTLVVYPERSSFAEPEPVVLHAVLMRGDRPVPALQITGQVLTESGQVLGELTYADDGGAFDARALDDVSTAAFEL